MSARGILRLMVSARMARPAIKVALVVGTVLNVINNGERVLAGEAVDPWHLALNYLVPFCVSAFSAARNESARQQGD
jgi:hypothetical protein